MKSWRCWFQVVFGSWDAEKEYVNMSVNLCLVGFCSRINNNGDVSKSRDRRVTKSTYGTSNPSPEYKRKQNIDVRGLSREILVESLLPQIESTLLNNAEEFQLLWKYDEFFRFVSIICWWYLVEWLGRSAQGRSSGSYRALYLHMFISAARTTFA
jgi:hypothetical protein